MPEPRNAAVSVSSPQPTAVTTSGWFVARLLVGAIDGLCVVSDLTSEGARVMSVLPLLGGDLVTIDLGEGGRVPGTVTWHDPTQCGVAFSRPLDAAALTTLVAGADGSAPRFKRCIPVLVERHGRLAWAELVEISPGGACLALPHEPWIRDGAEIEVTIDGFAPSEADVSWIEGDRIGITFRSPMQLWRLDNQLREWARECRKCPVGDCHTAPGPATFDHRPPTQAGGWPDF